MKSEVLTPTVLSPARARLMSACQKGYETGLELVARRYENNKDWERNLTYHNAAHSRYVAQETVRILEVVRSVDRHAVSQIGVWMGQLAAGWHDTTILWERVHTVEDGFEVARRKRLSGINERVSAEELVGYMTEPEFSRASSSVDEEILVKNAILVTVPDFDTSLGTVIQPNLTEDSSPVARAVALADIGGAGLSGGEFFLRTSLALFREDNLDFPAQTMSLSTLNVAQREALRQRMIEWLGSQGRFVEGRRQLTPQEVAPYGDASQAVLELFSYFDETLNIVGETHLKAQSEPVEALLTMFGYSVDRDVSARR